VNVSYYLFVTLFSSYFVSLIVTLNIGNNLIPPQQKFEYLLKAMASIGVVSNLQVSCPLVMLPLRDSLIQALGIPEYDLRLVSACITVIVTLFALMLKKEFAVTCSFIGSLATFTNSVILPIVFFHLMAGKNCSSSRSAFHLLIFSIAAGSALVGIYSDLSEMIHK
jgi:hypothetical protein